MKRNWEGLVLRAMGGRDFRLTVLRTESVAGRYQRLLLDDGGLLAACGIHPTMWIRLWDRALLGGLRGGQHPPHHPARTADTLRRQRPAHLPRLLAGRLMNRLGSRTTHDETATR